MLDLVTFDAALKELYTKDKVEKLVYSNFPFLSLVPKNTDFYGDNYVVPVYYGNPQGRSSTFTRAQASGLRDNSKTVKFSLNRARDYGIVTIDNETMEASANDKGAFLKARETEIDGIISSLSQSVATQLVGSGWGNIGQVGSFATTTITLSNVNDVVNFEVGQELVLSAALSTGNIRAVGTSTNGLFVTGVNRDTGVLTFGFNVNDATNGIPTIANSDFIAMRGDRDEAGTPSILRMVGLEAWLPFTAPTSTLFLGVDRTRDVTRLGGMRRDVSALPIEEALLDGAAYAAREGAKPDYYFINPMRYVDLVKALGSKVQYVDVQASESIGFRGLTVQAPMGEMKIVSDPTIPMNRCYGLTLSTWELKSLGELIKPLNSDGLQMLRMSNRDGVEVRYGYYSNLACHAPGKNIVLGI
jgi:hypothetical protein